MKYFLMGAVFGLMLILVMEAVKTNVEDTSTKDFFELDSLHKESKKNYARAAMVIFERGYNQGIEYKSNWEKSNKEYKWKKDSTDMQKTINDMYQQ